MNFIKSWAMVICFAAVSGGLVMLLLPQSNRLNKVFHMLVSLFFLCSIIFPISNKTRNISFYNQLKEENKMEEVAGHIEKNTNQFAYFLAKQNINKLIQERLTILNVYPEEVIIEFQNEDGKVKDIYAEIYGDNTLQGLEKKISDVIKQEFGIKAVCYFS